MPDSGKLFDYLRFYFLNVVSPPIDFLDGFGFPGEPRFGISPPYVLLQILGNRRSEDFAESLEDILDFAVAVLNLFLGEWYRLGFREIFTDEFEAFHVPLVFRRNLHEFFHVVVLLPGAGFFVGAFAAKRITFNHTSTPDHLREIPS